MQPTPRQRYRRYTGDDAQWYAHVSRDPEIQQFTTDPPDLTADAVRAAIAASRDDPRREAFLICGASDTDRLGNLAIELCGDEAELSYWVAPGARGRGVATRAIGFACRWVADHADAARVVLWAHVDNAASRRAAERAGFTLVGLGTRQLGPRVVPCANYQLTLRRD
ncbi:MAG TPA: GNAT family protein [Jatrophihabitantaceae bacterium]|jgi:RimJ/RimL family protein N-acetyltransferase|nr:GNAT family protein [Jatrophihabitantaceae bacterium]